MVQLRALFTSLALFLFLFTSSMLIHSASSRVHVVLEEKHVPEMHRAWQRKPWMNHGSFRGPRKHLVNPTVEDRFQVRELPV
ncbi:hypothetical protein L1049_022957 [Liquidambar formosana]|uniref:Uncharacterized protein n=1 Tax=Liquidambar formosana TaxID=63359 RepID=A0AAP0RER6_LIQFO